MGKTFLFVALISFFTNLAKGEDLKPFKKWVVFPFDSVDEKLKPSVDQSWWNVREKITEKKRFSVASKQFLIEKDVYQPRKKLKPEDVKYLSKLLEADLIITGWSEYRDFTINVYLAQNGELLWSKKLGFHPSLKASDQVVAISKRLITEFINKVPFHGSVVNSDDRTKNALSIDIGNNQSLNTDEDVAFIKLEFSDKWDSSLGFTNFTSKEILKTKVLKAKRAYAIVEIKSTQALPPEDTLVFVPSEQKRNNYQDSLSPELQVTMSDEGDGKEEHSKNTLIFGSVFSFLGILLLAF